MIEFEILQFLLKSRWTLWSSSTRNNLGMIQMKFYNLRKVKVKVLLWKRQIQQSSIVNSFHFIKLLRPFLFFLFHISYFIFHSYHYYLKYFHHQNHNIYIWGYVIISFIRVIQSQPVHNPSRYSSSPSYQTFERHHLQ